MAKCSSCGKEIANNTMLQVGNGSFCNEECSQKFDKNGKGNIARSAKSFRLIHPLKNGSIIPLITVALITAALIWLFTNPTDKRSDNRIDIQSDTVMAKFISPDNAFSVLLPGKVQEKRENLNSEIGPVEIFTYSAKSKHHDYTVVYVDYPHFMVKEQGAEELLNGASYGTVMDSHGKLMTENTIDLQGNPGRELKIVGPQKEYIRARLFLVNNRLYQIKVVSSISHTMDKDVEIMFDSFKLIGKEALRSAKKA
jgi:hypothetical protein